MDHRVGATMGRKGVIFLTCNKSAPHDEVIQGLNGAHGCIQIIGCLCRHDHGPSILTLHARRIA
jgi:hypothetical protein